MYAAMTSFIPASFLRAALLLMWHAASLQTAATSTPARKASVLGPHTSVAPGVHLVSDIPVPPSDADSAFELRFELPADTLGSDAPVTIDLYFPTSAKRTRRGKGKHGSKAKRSPLVILLPGGLGPKELFSMASINLAQAGYAVAVVSQPRNFTGTPVEDVVIDVDFTSANFVYPETVDQVLSWARETFDEGDASDQVLVDTSSAFLFGHSAGAAAALAGACDLCSEPGAAADDGVGCGGVRGMFLYGIAADNTTDVQRREQIAQCTVPPKLVVNGAGDTSSNRTSAGFDVQPAPKVAAVLAGLDHFSVANRKWLVRSDVESTLPRSEQVARVTTPAVLWFDALQELAGNEALSYHAIATQVLGAGLLPLLQQVQLLRSNLTGLPI